MDFRQVTAEELIEKVRGAMPYDKVLLMLDEAENEEHKFGLGETGKAETSRGLVIHHSLTTYFVSQADIGAYFEAHERPAKPMTLEQENVYLRAKLKEFEKAKAEREKKKLPSMAITAKELKPLTDLSAEKQPEKSISDIPPRDKTIPKPEPPQKPFTAADLRAEFSKEIHEKKSITPEQQIKAIETKEKKDKKRDGLA